MKHIFIIGSKGIPPQYGGFETFVEKLTEYHQDNRKIKYHVACKGTESDEYEYHNAHCFKLKVPNIGPAQAITYDLQALSYSIKYIKKHRIRRPIVYILGCSIGPFFRRYKKKIHKLGGEILLNPDGLEWMRQKWRRPVQRYLKLSEKLMVKHSDLIVCDSINIEKYIREEYAKFNPQTTFIPYGAEMRRSQLKDDDPKLLKWYEEKGLKAKEYYLVVGRFVPENNYETMIREFMKSSVKKDFALITNVSDRFLKALQERTHFEKDKRIKFVGTVYDQELLMKIRENTCGYLHGHEVGGTNPSLVEAMGTTDLNLLLGVSFNKEVGRDAALYWSKKPGSLAKLIDAIEQLSPEEVAGLGTKARKRVKEVYNWQLISDQYEKIFLRKKNKNLFKNALI